MNMRAPIFASLLLTVNVAKGHHSQAAFDQVEAELVGEIAEVNWGNPHVFFRLAVRDAQGSKVWRLEMDSPYVLGRYGIKETILQVGQNVEVIGRTSGLLPDVALVSNIQLPDGTELVLNPLGVRRWQSAARALGYKISSINVSTTTERVSAGLFRVWSSPQPPYRVADLPFRDEALEARAKWNVIDNFATRCEPEGMPRLMLNPHPFEFIDEGSRIVIRSELYELERVIHMGTLSGMILPSPLGHSTGRWEGGRLIVETDSINWPFFDNLGTPQSPDVKIREEFTIGANDRLDYRMTISDEVTFTREATVEGYWLDLGESVEPFDCQRLRN
jgi:hypothetical protein